MQIPPLERFRLDTDGRYGAAWQADPDGADFTLMIPDGEPVWEDGGWDARPHEPSHRLASDVLPELPALRDKALEFLAGIVAFEKLAMQGEPFVIGVHCDARARRVIVELEWTEELHCRFSVTFAWRDEPLQLPPWPTGMAFWGR